MASFFILLFVFGFLCALATSSIHCTINMPLDHFNFYDTRTFKNFYWMNDTFYKPGGPIFFMDSGEASIDDQTADRFLNLESGTQAAMELARIYSGIAILWEHRFFGGSMPFAYNETTGVAFAEHNAYKYLDIEQAMEDAVYFAKNFHPPGYNDHDACKMRAKYTPWIWIGGSYPGARAAMIRQRNPDVFFASWASSAIVQSQLDASVYYSPVYNHMPKNCSADIHAAITYADDVFANGSPEEGLVLRKALSLAYIDNRYNNVTNPASIKPEDLSLWSISKIIGFPFQGSFFNFQNVGYFGLSLLCDSIATWNPTNTTVDSPETVLIPNPQDGRPTSGGIAVTYGPRVAFNAYVHSMILKARADWSRFPIIFPSALDVASWKWVLCNEFAQWQVANTTSGKNLVSRFYNVSATEASYCKAVFPYLPAHAQVSHVLKYGGWAMRPSNVMFTNGGGDPWRTVGVQAVTETNPEALNRPSTKIVPPCNVPPPGMEVFGQVYPGMVHASDLSNTGFLPTNSLQDGLELFTQALDVWLKCFKGAAPLPKKTSK